jgi:hypothetical protein
MQTSERQPPSPGAERMRRLRERRRQGKVCFIFELDPRAISGLVELRWLPASQQDDHTAVINAFRGFVRYALVTQHARR